MRKLTDRKYAGLKEWVQQKVLKYCNNINIIMRLNNLKINCRKPVLKTEFLGGHILLCLFLPRPRH